MKVFISYSHRQGQWVWERLVPVLRAAGCSEVLVDHERFTAGFEVQAQMDTTQDQADVNILVLSPAYFASAPCQHEMKRALATDPDFRHGTVLPVVIEKCDVSALGGWPKGPLRVDLTDDRKADAWDLLLKSLDARALGTTASHWLDVRDEVVRKFGDQQQSVNLVIRGKPNWRALLHHIQCDWLPALAVVDLDDPATTTLDGLVRAILTASDLQMEVPRGTGAVAALNAMKSLPRPQFLVFKHFENVITRRKAYGVEIFYSLRHLVSDERKLVALFESRTRFRELLPKEHPLSVLHPEMIELREDGV